MNARLKKLLLALVLCVACGAHAHAQRVVSHDTPNEEAPLNNSSIVKLVRAGFSEKTVVVIIRTRPARFDLAPDRLVELKKSGVSEKIILAMLARDDGEAFNTDGNDWENDDFFKEGSSAKGSGSGTPSDGATGIFGSSGGSRNRSRSGVGGGGNTNDTQTNGSATVRILRPPAEAGGTSAKLERTPTLTNDSIVELVEAGFSEGTIIRRIELSPVAFDLSTPKLAELRRRRVTEPVIAAMKSAMEDETEPARPER
ncbi:MAG TPA: hypothetical protein VGB73_11915 [Pyrinomonadaceae bacterium]|jgi:hypothetical protein